MGPGIVAAIPYEPLIRDRDSERSRPAVPGSDPQCHQADALGCVVVIHLAHRWMGWHLWQLA
jgi:hypothetical protein